MPVLPFFLLTERPDSMTPGRHAQRRNLICQGCSSNGFPARSPEGISIPPAPRRPWQQSRQPLADLDKSAVMVSNPWAVSF